MKVQCPQCRTEYKIRPEKIPKPGCYARCARCRTRFFVRPDTDSPLPPPSQNCKNCGRIIGKYEKPCRYEGHIICYECYQRLDKAMMKSSDPRIREKFQTVRNTSGSTGKILNRFFACFSNDLAIDLGTANTLVYKKRKGIVLNESSVVALRTDMVNGKSVLAVGMEAKRMMGKTPGNVIAVRPMRDGVIADFEITGAMLCRFIRKVRGRIQFFKPRMIIAVPSGISSVEKRAVKESAEQAGARSVLLVEEPMAAAIGAGLPVAEPTCNMIVDIGGGTTEVAVISLGGIVSGISVKVAGDEMDEAIKRYIRKQYNFLIGERTAEEIKISIGNACPHREHPESIEVKGWDVVSGRPMLMSLNALEVREAIAEQLKAISDAVKTVLEKTPQELAANALDNGIVVTGGVARLKNMEQYLSDETGLPIRIAEAPLTTIVMGAGKILDNRKLFQKFLSGKTVSPF